MNVSVCRYESNSTLHTDSETCVYACAYNLAAACWICSSCTGSKSAALCHAYLFGERPCIPLHNTPHGKGGVSQSGGGGGNNEEAITGETEPERAHDLIS